MPSKATAKKVKTKAAKVKKARKALKASVVEQATVLSSKVVFSVT